MPQCRGGERDIGYRLEGAKRTRRVFADRTALAGSLPVVRAPGRTIDDVETNQVPCGFSYTPEQFLDGKFKQRLPGSTKETRRAPWQWARSLSLLLVGSAA
jgi:hypothetical protein